MMPVAVVGDHAMHSSVAFGAFGQHLSSQWSGDLNLKINILMFGYVANYLDHQTLFSIKWLTKNYSLRYN
jgi:hypothetical protein